MKILLVVTSEHIYANRSTFEKTKHFFLALPGKVLYFYSKKKKKLSEKKDVCVKRQHFPQRRHYCKLSSYSTGYQDKTGENNLTRLLSLADSC